MGDNSGAKNINIQKELWDSFGANVSTDEPDCTGESLKTVYCATSLLKEVMYGQKDDIKKELAETLEHLYITASINGIDVEALVLEHIKRAKQTAAVSQ